jgi:hypothetical protein
VTVSSEWREERCEECGAGRERRWIVRIHKTRTAVPAGFHVQSHRSNSSWSTIAGLTSDVSLCDCDGAW